MEYTIGQIVISKCGHDKGKAFVIISTEDNYVYLSDGNLRPVEKPKLKKVKHIQKTNYVCEKIEDAYEKGDKLLNEDIRKSLKAYCNI